MKVARNAPATPSTMVRMKPPGLLGPGEMQARQDAGDQSDDENPKHVRLLMSRGTEPAVCDAVI